MSSPNHCDIAAWALCAPGTLQALARRHRATRRREAMRRVTTPLVLLAVLGVGAWTTSQAIRHSKPHYGGISCRDVQASLNLFNAGRLPDALNQRMAAHLCECPWCELQLREMNQQLPDEVGTTPLYDYTILASILSLP